MEQPQPSDGLALVPRDGTEVTSTSHANERGNAAQRRARKVRLVADYGVPMVMAEITVDRALPGIEGVGGRLGAERRFGVRCG